MLTKPGSNNPPRVSRDLVRRESLTALKALALDVERLEITRHLRAGRVSPGLVDYLLHALLGLVPWPTDPRDLERITLLARVLETRTPGLAPFIREKTGDAPNPKGD